MKTRLHYAEHSEHMLAFNYAFIVGVDSGVDLQVTSGLEWGKSLNRRPLPHSPFPLYTLYRAGTNTGLVKWLSDYTFSATCPTAPAGQQRSTGGVG